MADGIDDQRPAVTEVDEIGAVAVAFIDHGDDISHVDPPQAHTPSGRSGDRAVAGVAPDALTDAVLGAPIVGVARIGVLPSNPTSARRAVGAPSGWRVARVSAATPASTVRLGWLPPLERHEGSDDE
jgi:hypothetical protein